VKYLSALNNDLANWTIFEFSHSGCSLLITLVIVLINDYQVIQAMLIHPT